MVFKRKNNYGFKKGCTAYNKGKQVDRKFKCEGTDRKFMRDTPAPMMCDSISTVTKQTVSIENVTFLRPKKNPNRAPENAKPERYFN